jgi:hypothetical protein
VPSSKSAIPGFDAAHPPSRNTKATKGTKISPRITFRVSSLVATKIDSVTKRDDCRTIQFPKQRVYLVFLVSWW